MKNMYGKNRISEKKKSDYLPYSVFVGFPGVLCSKDNGLKIQKRLCFRLLSIFRHQASTCAGVNPPSSCPGGAAQGQAQPELSGYAFVPNLCKPTMPSGFMASSAGY